MVSALNISLLAVTLASKRRFIYDLQFLVNI